MSDNEITAEPQQQLSTDNVEEEQLLDESSNSGGGATAITQANTEAVTIELNTKSAFDPSVHPEPTPISQPAATTQQISPEADKELKEIQKRVAEMNEEAERLKQVQSEVEAAINPGSQSAMLRKASVDSLGSIGTGSGLVGGYSFPSLEEKIEADSKSIYVGQVDYEAAAEEVEEHFRGCGAVNRVTIMCDKYSGQPKGFCFIEFADKESVETAMALDGSLLRGRTIKVMPKRTNKPGISYPYSGRGAGGPRGRGRGRGVMRGRGGRGRGRGRARGFAPY